MNVIALRVWNNVICLAIDQGPFIDMTYQEFDLMLSPFLLLLVLEVVARCSAR